MTSPNTMLVETSSTPTFRRRPESTLRWLVYGLCLASSTFQQAIVPLLPEYTRRFDLSGFETGTLLAATALSTMAVSLPAGTLSDRFGARRLTVVACCIMTLSMLVEAFAPSFPVLLFARLLFGAGYGVVWTAGLTWLASVSETGRALGGTVTCSGVGGIIGPLVAGGLADLVGIVVPFLAAATVFVVFGVALSVMQLPDPLHSAETPSLRGSAAGVLRNGRIVAATAAVIIAGLSWTVTYLVGPAEIRAAGVSTASIGLVLSVAAGVFVLGSVITTSLGARAIRTRWILLAIAAVGFAFTPGVLSAAPLAVTAMICATAAARSVLWTVCYPLAARGAERVGVGVGVVMGLLQAVWATTSVLAPLGAGALSGVASPATVFALTGMCCLGVLGVTVAWMMRRPLHDRSRLALDR